jgi:putative aldouronate transport system permease protein
MPIFCAKANNLKKSKKAKLQNCLNAHYLQNYQKFFVSFSKTAEYNEGVQKKLGRLLKNFCYGRVTIMEKHRVRKKRSFLQALREDGVLYAFTIPGVIFLLLFCYFPMAGLVLVFKDYNFKGGIFGSPWADPIYKNFTFFFNSLDKALRATWNTVMLNTLYFIFGTLVAVAIAIMLTEIKSKVFIKASQSIMFFPYFISWIVFGSILSAILDYDRGTINGILNSMGFASVDFYSEPVYWIFILVICNVWNSAGYSSIIYYATLNGIDPGYYEAAKVDGASKWQQITRITLPLLRPTIIMMFLLAVGNMLRGNLTMIMGLTNLNPILLPVTDIIDVFVYRSSIQSGEMAFSSAISLYQSVVGFVLVLVSNALVRKVDRDSALF